MDLLKQLHQNFSDSINLKAEVAKTLLPVIIDASQVLAQCISNGGKILSCGNGGSVCDALHFNAEVANRFMLERDGLSALSLVPDPALLTAIANDYDYKDIFSKQIKALGKKDDVLLAISTSGNSENVVRAILKAHECGIKIIALTGNNGGRIATVLNATDIEIRVPSQITPRIQEAHILVIHSLCELLDLFLSEKKR